MLNKYRRDNNGKLVKIADIYTFDEHRLSKNMFDDEAVAICKRLQDEGFEAYIVGGAVRDLLLEISPKDFDIATNAHPARIKKIFKGSHIIGFRFKLVHVRGTAGKIFEIATFRVSDPDASNVYGTLEEDAFRRDFTLNALYYDPIEERIIDFHRGYPHILNRVIEPVVPLNFSFTEDPVRMIRAIKYANTTDSRLSKDVKLAIKRNAENLKTASHSRLAEELLKIIVKPSMANILKDCYEFKVLANFLPVLSAYLDRLSKPKRDSYFKQIDMSNTKDDLSKGRVLYSLLDSYVKDVENVVSGNAEQVFNTMKMALSPIVLPNALLYEVVALIYSVEGVPLKLQKEKKKDDEKAPRKPARRRFRNRRVKPKDFFANDE